MPQDLKNAVVRFYRDELDRRYLLGNVRRFRQFDDVSDAHVEALRSYFLTHIYPPVERREKLDEAINRLGDVLKSPRRLRPLMGAALKSMWRLGPSLRTAVSAGISTLDAYNEARKLERIMTETAAARGVTAADAGDRSRMIAIMCDVPEKDVARLIKDIMKLFHALSNTRMLATAVAFLEQCTQIMVLRPELYPPEEIEGITLGRQLVQGGLDLFLQLDPMLFPKIIEGIEQVEWDWYRRAMEEAQLVGG
ncbi:MAG: hypothetical protein WD873_03820 [Candidatus Hydrogenedentales bacterium]